MACATQVETSTGTYHGGLVGKGLPLVLLHSALAVGADVEGKLEGGGGFGRLAHTVLTRIMCNGVFALAATEQAAITRGVGSPLVQAECEWGLRETQRERKGQSQDRTDRCDSGNYCIAVNILNAFVNMSDASILMNPDVSLVSRVNKMTGT